MEGLYGSREKRVQEVGFPRDRWWKLGEIVKNIILQYCVQRCRSHKGRAGTMSERFL